MPYFDYLVYDVFTDRRFGGNPLAIFPDARGLSEDRLLPIAREFNLSETTFVYPPDDPAHTAKVRIFTPTGELAFAGHPTVGTAIALAGLGRSGADMVLELGVGPIPVRVDGNHARFETRIPLSHSEAPDAEAIGACIGQSGDVIRTDRHRPVLAGLGTDFVLAELTGDAALATARGVSDAFREMAGAGAAMSMLYVYLRDGQSIQARMFAPLGGIPEDPATGGAAAALVAWLGKLEGRSQRFEITQGVEMGRPSLIEAEVTVENGEPVAVAIGGKAVPVMEGRLLL